MQMLTRMLVEVLNTGESRTLEAEQARQVVEEYFNEVAEPLEEISRQKRQAIEESRFVVCR